jgi:hypothetical protein
VLELLACGLLRLGKLPFRCVGLGLGCSRAQRGRGWGCGCGCGCGTLLLLLLLLLLLGLGLGLCLLRCRRLSTDQPKATIESAASRQQLAVSSQQAQPQHH